MRRAPIRLTSAVLAALLATLPAEAAQSPAAPPASATAAPVAGADEGVRLVLNGKYPEAVVELSAAIARLQPLGAVRSADLAQAYLYRGVAEAAQAHDGRARENYRQALALNPTLRLGGSFPPHAMELFEAVRTKPEKPKPEMTPSATTAAPSPMTAAPPASGAASPAEPAPAEPAPAASPAPATVQGGPGRLVQLVGVGVIAAGAMVGGAVALAGHQSTSTGSSTNGTVVPGASSGPGVIVFDRTTADPVPGSSIPCGGGCDLPRILLTLRADQNLGANNVTVSLFDEHGTICSQSDEPVDLPPGQATSVNVALHWTGGCALPTTITRMFARTNPAAAVLSQEWFLNYIYTK